MSIHHFHQQSFYIYDVALTDNNDMSATLKQLHDRLLAGRPEGAEHDEQACPLCAMEAVPETGGNASTSAQTEGGNTMTTFTQEQLDAAVAEAVAKAVAEATAPLQEKITQFESAQAESEVGQAVAEATAPLNEQISQLQSELEAAVLAQTAAEQAKAEIEQFWAEAIAEKEAAEAAEARKEERLAKIREVANFPEDFLEKNADKYAAMSDEDFEARLEELAEQAKTIAEKVGTGVPSTTALTAARETGGSTNPGSSLSELKNFRRSLVNPSSL